MINMGGVTAINSPPKSLINGFSTGGCAAQTVHALGGKLILSGALTADVYKEILAVSGSGMVDIALVKSENLGDKSMGLKIVIDGVTVFDSYCATVGGAYYGIVGIGHLTYGAGGYSPVVPQPFIFNASLSIQIKSSLTGSNEISAVVSYQTL